MRFCIRVPVTPVGTFVFTVWNIIHCLITKLAVAPKKGELCFNIEESLIVPVVLYGSETWSVALREHEQYHVLQIFNLLTQSGNRCSRTGFRVQKLCRLVTHPV